MTWSRARLEALRLIEEVSRLHGKPSSIELSIYVSEATYRIHKPNEAWTWAFHTQVTRAMQRELLKRGYSVNLRAI